MQSLEPVGNRTRPGAQISLSAISEALNLFQGKAGVWVVVSLIYLIVQILGAAFNKQLSHTNPLLDFVILIIFAIISAILYAGIFTIAIKQIKGQIIEVGDLFSAVDFAWPVFWGSLIIAVLILIGLIFCIIPGVIIAGLSIFTVPLIIDQRMKASDAVSTSFATLKGQWLSAAVFAFVVGLIYLVGTIILIGVIVTMPITILSITVAYRDFFLGQTPPASGSKKFEPAIPPGN